MHSLHLLCNLDLSTTHTSQSTRCLTQYAVTLQPQPSLLILFFLHTSQSVRRQSSKRYNFSLGCLATSAGYCMCHARITADHIKLVVGIDGWFDKTYLLPWIRSFFTWPCLNLNYHETTHDWMWINIHTRGGQTCWRHFLKMKQMNDLDNQTFKSQISLIRHKDSHKQHYVKTKYK